MPIAFLLDENISPEIAVIARRFGLAVVPMQDVLAKGVDDDIVLAYAAVDGRCVVTANGRDFRKLSREYQASGRPHAGIVAVPHPLPRSWSSGLVVALLRIARQYPNGLGPWQTVELSEEQVKPG